MAVAEQQDYLKEEFKKMSSL
jgi:hypothetical protein